MHSLDLVLHTKAVPQERRSTVRGTGGRDSRWKLMWRIMALVWCAQMGAWASNQSRPIASRAELEAQLKSVEVRARTTLVARA
jgi:pyridoxine/pyridoxamine 5'-phosphate oxidase